MDILLMAAGALLIAGLFYAAWSEWQKSGSEARLALIMTLVAAAQQLHGHQPGAMRYKWVAERVVQRFPDIDRDELIELIEAAVYRLKQQPARTEPAEASWLAQYWRKN